MYSDLNSIPSELILDAMFAIDLLQQGKKSIEKAGDGLQKLVEDLAALGLDDESVFRLRRFDGVAFWDYLKKRDGVKVWETPPNTSVDKVFAAIREEYLNLKDIYGGKKADFDKAMRFCVWMHDRAVAIRTPIRYRRLAA